MHLKIWPNDTWASYRRHSREIRELCFVFASRLLNSHRISELPVAEADRPEWPSIGPTGDFSLFYCDMARDLLGFRGAGWVDSSSINRG